MNMELTDLIFSLKLGSGFLLINENYDVVVRLVAIYMIDLLDNFLRSEQHREMDLISNLAINVAIFYYFKDNEYAPLLLALLVYRAIGVYKYIQAKDQKYLNTYIDYLREILILLLITESWDRSLQAILIGTVIIIKYLVINKWEMNL
jgi:hypothetical protein